MNFEQQIHDLAQQFDYPPTPNVRVEMGRIGRKQPMPRLAYGLAILLILCASLLAVPEVRATVAAVLRLGAVEIVETPVLPTVPTTIYDLPDLPGRTTLDAVEPPVAIPTILDQPDAVFVHRVFSDTVTLYWRDEQVVLQRLNGSTFATKLQPTATLETTVNGYPALWITGAHWLTIYDEQFAPIEGLARYVEGNVLIWQVGDVTYRLESAENLADAVRIAESIE